MPPVRNNAARNWVWTFNNPNVDPPTFLATLSELAHFRYVIFSLEEGDSGTPHYQGYIEYDKPVRFNAVRANFPAGVHIEPRRGTRDQARDYCRKPEGHISGPFEAGEWSVQGARTDIETCTTELRQHRSIKRLAEDHPAEYVKFHRGFKELLSATAPARGEAPSVILYYGATGTGKTRKAYADYPQLYRKLPDTRWFDGYTDNRVVLFDDFSGAASKLSLAYLLQLLDRYPISVEIKGSYAPLLATTIIVTTNIHPRLWYDYSNREEQYNALARRFHEIWHFPADLPPRKVTFLSFFHDWAQYCDENARFQPVEDIPDVD